MTSDEEFGDDSSDEFDDEDDLDLSAENGADDDEDEADEDDEIGAEGNRIVGGVPKGVLEYVARNIVDDPDGVFVETSERRGGEVELRLHVSPADMGKVIGRRGRVAQALRQVVAAAGTKEGVRASLDIVD
ncbi:MAG TPA: KH domain-containing protein [Acidimicrobiia bacterium]|nr:KH domain-containing protein [Acidimicrobiia bacterium]